MELKEGFKEVVGDLKCYELHESVRGNDIDSGTRPVQESGVEFINRDQISETGTRFISKSLWQLAVIITVVLELSVFDEVQKNNYLQYIRCGSNQIGTGT